MVTLKFCLRNSKTGDWSPDASIWAISAEVAPLRGSTVELDIRYDKRSDQGFPEREKELPLLAEKLFQVMAIHHKFSAQFEPQAGVAGYRVPRQTVFVIVEEIAK
jgi:hypothetical protein